MNQIICPGMSSAVNLQTEATADSPHQTQDLHSTKLFINIYISDDNGIKQLFSNYLQFFCFLFGHKNIPCCTMDFDAKVLVLKE